jgi:hypothetical protein
MRTSFLANRKFVFRFAIPPKTPPSVQTKRSEGAEVVRNISSSHSKCPRLAPNIVQLSPFALS